MNGSDQLINLQRAMASYRAWLQEQLAACQSGKFKLFSVEGARTIDVTDRQIADLKRLIEEHDKFVGT
jgi:hypothetical protein